VQERGEILKSTLFFKIDIGRDSETPSILYSSNDDIKKDRTKSQPTTASKSGLPQRRPRIGLSRNR
jgi:hypothetical protein